MRPASHTSFKDLLSRETAFYQDPNYSASTKQDLESEQALPTTYRWDTQSKITRVVKKIFSILFFPIALYHLLHCLAGKIIIPASTPFLLETSLEDLNSYRSNISLDSNWKYKRITLEVDGYKVDAVITGTSDTLDNGKWVVYSGGNGEYYEHSLIERSDIKELLNNLKANCIFFNYPGVSASSGMPNRAAIANAYRAVLSFLEDDIHGVGAKQIIGFGHSIGGGVQADALNNHQPKPGIQYVFVKSKTFSNLSQTVSSLTYRVLGLLVKLLGWNIDTAASSKKLTAPEIILQSRETSGFSDHNYTILDNSSTLMDNDGIISKQNSLAHALLNDPACPRKNKIFVGVPEYHNTLMWDTGFLATKINKFLAPSKATL